MFSCLPADFEPAISINQKINQSINDAKQANEAHISFLRLSMETIIKVGPYQLIYEEDKFCLFVCIEV